MESRVAVKRIAVLHTGTSVQDENTASRIRIAGARLGIEVKSFARSEDIVPFAPDFVLALSAQDPKLTGFPTYGVMHAPPRHYQQTRRLMRNVMSYDAYLAGSKRLRRWLKDACFGAHKMAAPVGFFFPSAQMTSFETTINPESQLAFTGERLTEPYHTALFKALSRTRFAKFYGDAKLWKDIDSQAYFGAVPPDGESAIARHRNAGIGLCLVPEESGAPDLPPSSLFEIIAGGAIAICTRTPFVEAAFGDSVLYIDGGRSPNDMMAQIIDHVMWVRSHPDQAQVKAFEAHSILQQRFTLERLLLNVIEMHRTVLVEKGYTPDPAETPESLPSVSFIMRTGGRPLPLIRRALDSVAAQNHPRITVIFVLYAQFPELHELVKQYPTLTFKFVQNIGGMRSTALVEGMKAVDTDFFGLLDDDDEFHPNHVRMLLRTIRHHDNRDLRGSIGFAYAASIEVWAEGGREEKPEWRDYLLLPREQRRIIEHFRWYTSSMMRQYQFFLMSNSWIARTSLINEDILDDPELDTCEDLYLALQFAQRTHFAFSVEVTAIHHFHGFGHSTDLDRSKHIPDTQRIGLRGWRRSFPEVLPYDIGVHHAFQFHEERNESVVAFDSNLLGCMTLRGDLAASADGSVVVPRESEPGVAVYGPNSRLPHGAYTLSYYLDVTDLTVTHGPILRIDVSRHNGNTIWAARDLLAEELGAGGSVVRVDVSFDVWPELAMDKFEFRLWHAGRARVTVFRIVVQDRTVKPKAELESHYLTVNYN